MKRFFLVLLMIAASVTMAFAGNQDNLLKTSYSAVQTDQNSGFMAPVAATLTLTATNTSYDISSYIPPLCTNGRIYVYGGDAFFGPFASLSATGATPQAGYAVSAGSYYEIKGHRPGTAHRVGISPASTTTTLTLKFVFEGPNP